MLTAKPGRILVGAAAVMLLASACTGPPELSTPELPVGATTSETTAAPNTTDLSKAQQPESSTSDAPKARACLAEIAPAVNPWAEAAAEALNHPGFSGLDVSASIWVDGFGEVVAHKADLQLFPASNQKLFTAVGVLTLLNEDHRFTTSVEVVGDSLVLRAGGDPTLRSTGRHSLAELAKEVSSAKPSGIVRLIVDAGHFEPSTTTKGRQDWQLPTYTGPLSAFIVDDNRWRTDAGFVADPALENGKLFADKLRSLGISIETVEHTDNYEPAGIVIASFDSVPTSDLLTTMLMSSDNEIAESLLREIGAGSTAAGITQIDNWLADKCPSIAGKSGDGSGLSRANLRASREWRQLLQLARETEWGESLFESLPVAGQSGTMNQRLTGPQTAGKLRAKTGTIIGGRSLSGYATTIDGHSATFSIVTNGEPIATDSSVAAIDNLIAAIVRTSIK